MYNFYRLLLVALGIFLILCAADCSCGRRQEGTLTMVSRDWQEGYWSTIVIDDKGTTVPVYNPPEYWINFRDPTGKQGRFSCNRAYYEETFEPGRRMHARFSRGPIFNWLHIHKVHGPDTTLPPVE